jgi:chloride channel protein, CIC family
MTSTAVGRVPIVNRESGALVGLVGRRDLLRVRTNMVQHEREREALIRVLPRRQEYESTEV